MKRRWLHSGLAVAMLWGQSLMAQISLGPYIQRVKTDRATVVWYTDASTPGVLRYGTTSGQWLSTINVPAGTVHAAEVTGLKPNTKYFYDISDGAKTLATGQNYYFETHIPAGVRTPFSFIAAGDLGDGSQNQKDIAARMLSERPKHKFGLLLGDITYSNGARSEYLKYYFPIYKELIPHFAFFPCLGNHDVKTSRAAAYMEFFYTPANNPDGLENYYSFDYANAHIAALDDELLISGNDFLKQLNWVKQDLADAKSRGQNWLIVMFHKPPYSAGTHGDDDFTKASIAPILEAAGVDLVLCGHSHVAERTFLLNNNKIINQSTNTYPKTGAATPVGTVYVVSGSGGKTGAIDAKHPLMAFQQGDLGGFEIVYINGDTLRGKFMKKDGSIIDNFTMTKKGNFTSVEMAKDSQPPMQFVLNYPNPLRLSQAPEGLNITFEITRPTPIQAAVYDLTGREVARLSNGEIFNPGRHALQWNGKGQQGETIAAGAYFYRLQADSQTNTAKVLLLP